MLEEARVRHTIPGVTWDFSRARDINLLTYQVEGFDMADPWNR